MFLLCELDGNKITYSEKDYKLKEIINKINDSIVLVFNDIYDKTNEFVNKKQYNRYFKDEKFNLEKTSYILPNSSNYFVIAKFNKIISEKFLEFLPSSIKYIKFNDSFNSSIDKLIESEITHIYFNRIFNQPIDNLPWTIEYLYFGINFNQKLENLPGSVKKIIFDNISKFNQPLDSLPNSIEYLFLPNNYSLELNNLPNFLSHLELSYKYPLTLNNLPSKLSKFVFHYDVLDQVYYKNISFDNTLKSSEFIIPKTKHEYYEKKLIFTPNIKWIEKVFVNLPPNLKLLDLTYSYKLNLLSEYVIKSVNDVNNHMRKEAIINSQILDKLPPNLEILKYPVNYNLILVENIPQNIVQLFFSNKFNQSVDKLLNPNFGTSNPPPPTKLTHLIFGDEFNNNVNYLPNTLTHIYFGSKFNKSIDKLPNSIIFIKFGSDFNKLINNLPNGLEEIIFGSEFDQTINVIGPNVKKIQFPYVEHKCTMCEIINDDEQIIYKYYYHYNHKIKKLPKETKLYLKKINDKTRWKNYENFYSIFDNFKDNIVYY